MSNEKELSQFRALDFDAEDILFSSLVRYHFEREAAEDLEKLNAGEFDAMPEETDCARKRAEKYYRREQRLRILRHGYHVMQKGVCPKFCVKSKMCCKIEKIFLGGSEFIRCCRIYILTPVGMDVKGGEAVLK